NNGIPEERSSTARILIAGSDQHGFRLPDFKHGIACFRESWRRSPFREVTAKVRVFDVWISSTKQAEGHTEDDESSAFGGVEDARAIPEGTSLCTQLANLTIAQIKHEDGRDRIGYLLPIGSNILDRSSTNAAGNPAKALDS